MALFQIGQCSIGVATRAVRSCTPVAESRVILEVDAVGVVIGTWGPNLGSPAALGQ